MVEVVATCWTAPTGKDAPRSKGVIGDNERIVPDMTLAFVRPASIGHGAQLGSRWAQSLATSALRQ